jgi:hypothetical protein
MVRLKQLNIKQKIYFHVLLDNKTIYLLYNGVYRNFIFTPFNLSNSDLYMIILPKAELLIYKRYFIGYKVTVT